MIIAIEIIVVDNQSTDETAKLIQFHYPHVQVIISPTNRGFGGNNYGFKSFSGDYIALVNPDLQVHPSMLAALVQYLKANPGIGVVGPRTTDADGHISITAHTSIHWQQLRPHILALYSVFRPSLIGVM